MVAKGHVVSVSLDDQRQRVASTTAYTYTGRTVGSVGLGYLGKIGDHQVQLASREDRYSDFGSANTWLGGYGYNLDSDWKLTAMRSTAFRAPSFNDKFFPGSVSLDVKPETTQSNELGVQYAAGGHLLRVVRFSTQYVNLIEFPAPSFIARNVGNASVEGTEVSYTGQYASWDLRASLTLQTPINALTGVQLIRRSPQFGNVVANTTLGGWKVGGEYAFSAKRLDTDLAGARVELDAYQTVKLTARHDFGKQWYVAAKLENLFDARYQSAYGFNQASRGLFMTVGWKQ
jgi:vitamin B12 transporter